MNYVKFIDKCFIIKWIIHLTNIYNRLNEQFFKMVKENIIFSVTLFENFVAIKMDNFLLVNTFLEYLILNYFFHFFLIIINIIFNKPTFSNTFTSHQEHQIRFIVIITQIIFIRKQVPFKSLIKSLVLKKRIYIIRMILINTL